MPAEQADADGLYVPRQPNGALCERENGGQEMDLLLALALIVTVVAGGAAAVMLKNMLRAAVAVGASSVALAALFFLLGAPYAGAFELSVGAGLISVLFIVAITLTESMEGENNAS